MTQVPRIMRRKFLDSLRINVKGGVGGMGLPKYGGIGGKGGNVVAVASKNVSLYNLLRKYPEKSVRAETGLDSSRKKIYGENGSDKIIEVPVGIEIYDMHKRLVGSLDKEGDRVIVAQGGVGGSAQSSPAFNGVKGEQQVITLDLKLIADVGLVGFPNAGKSTLLKAVSRANPRIAAFPFTTIKPNLGVLSYPDFRQIKMADLPGLIEGAHYNIGMGHKFLKHVERTKLLLFVADIDGFQLSVNYKKRSCLETILLLNKELELYKEELLNKPAMLVVNKMDLPGANQHFEEISHNLENLADAAKQLPTELRPERIVKFDDILAISAMTCPSDAEKVKESVRRILDLHYDCDIMDVQISKEKEIIQQKRSEENSIRLM